MEIGERPERDQILRINSHSETKNAKPTKNKKLFFGQKTKNEE